VLCEPERLLVRGQAYGWRGLVSAGRRDQQQQAPRPAHPLSIHCHHHRHRNIGYTININPSIDPNAEWKATAKIHK
jgi:hypothetical protein